MNHGFAIRHALFALTMIPALAHSQSAVADSVNACMQRDTATVWVRMTMTWQNETAWTNDSLRRVLIRLADEDQAVRSAAGIRDSTNNPGFVRRMAVSDSIHLVQLKAIVDRFGWPTKSMVGARGASAAFLIAQHNEAYLPEALRLMQQVPPGEVQPSDMAMAEDRVLTRQGQPQRYGSQLKPVTGQMAEFYPIDSIGDLDARRARVGLPPIALYICMMRAYIGRPVKFPP